MPHYSLVVAFVVVLLSSLMGEWFGRKAAEQWPGGVAGRWAAVFGWCESQSGRPKAVTGARQLIANELGKAGGRVAVRVVQSPSVVNGILDEAGRGYDLMVIGASEEWFLRNWLFESIPDAVAERALCSVLLVRKHEPALLSWFRRMAKRVH